MLFPATVPRCRSSLQARAANFRLRILSPCHFHSFNSSTRGVRGSPTPWSACFPPTGFLIPPASSFHRKFYASATMASKIDGTAIAKSIREGLKAEIDSIQATNPRFKPNLVIFQGMHSSRASIACAED